MCGISVGVPGGERYKRAGKEEHGRAGSSKKQRGRDETPPEGLEKQAWDGLPHCDRHLRVGPGSRLLLGVAVATFKADARLSPSIFVVDFLLLMSPWPSEIHLISWYC